MTDSTSTSKQTIVSDLNDKKADVISNQQRQLVLEQVVYECFKIM